MSHLLQLCRVKFSPWLLAVWSMVFVCNFSPTTRLASTIATEPTTLQSFLAEPSSDDVTAPVTAPVTRAPKFLWGILSMDSDKEKLRRQTIRETYLSYYKHHGDAPNRICSLSEYRQWKKEDPEAYASCQLIYAFVMGSNPHGSPTLCNVTDPNYPLTVKPPTEELAKEQDVVHLNMRENMNEGKSPSWFRYGVSLLDKEHLEFDYVAKVDVDTLVIPDTFFDKLQDMQLPAGNQTALVYGGSTIGMKSPALLLSKTWMQGGLYFLSTELSRHIANPWLNREALAGYRHALHEDLKMANLVHSHPRSHEIRIAAFGKFQNKFRAIGYHKGKAIGYHYLKQPAQLQRLWQQATANLVYPRAGDSDVQLQVTLKKTTNAALEFVHIPKTGGTAVEAAAARKNVTWGMCHYWNLPGGSAQEFPGCFLKEVEPTKPCGLEACWHRPPSLIKDKKDGSWASPYNQRSLFAVVRNPYQRLISEYYCPWEGYKKADKNHASFNSFVHMKLSKYRMDDPKRVGDTHSIPQSQFIFDILGENTAEAPPQQRVDHVLFYEDFSNQLHALMKAYDLPIALDSHKTNPGTKDGEGKRMGLGDFDPETIGLINEVYREDFVYLGYTMIDPTDLEGDWATSYNDKSVYMVPSVVPELEENAANASEDQPLNDDEMDAVVLV